MIILENFKDDDKIFGKLHTIFKDRDWYVVKQHYDLFEWIDILVNIKPKVLVNSWDSFGEKLDDNYKSLLNYLFAKEGYFTFYNRETNQDLDTFMHSRMVFMPVEGTKNEK